MKPGPASVRQRRVALAEPQPTTPAAPGYTTVRAKRPTMKDVAAHVGVSRQLVSMVLRGAAGPSVDTRDRVYRAARELGYRPDTAARATLTGGHTVRSR